MMESRYTRQIQLKDFGPKAQQKLGNSRILVVGLGGLGLPVLQYLNAMGVGTLGIVDQDHVEHHNLQRQVWYTEKDIGRSKLEVVQERLKEQNSTSTIHGYDQFLVKENALDIIKDYDVIVDATDNFPTRYLINDACVILNKPFIYGALHGFEGHVSVFNHDTGPTYRCLYPNMPTMDEVPNCDENGVLGVLPGVIGTLQALETVKVLTGIGEVLSGKLLVFDGLHQRFTKINFDVVPENKSISQLQERYEDPSCGLVMSITAEEFQNLTNPRELQVLDVRTVQEFTGDHLPNAQNIPLDTLNLLPKSFNSNDNIYVVCQSGKRGQRAIQKLLQNNPELKLYNVTGGMDKLNALCP